MRRGLGVALTCLTLAAQIPEFQNRLAQYRKLREKAVAGLPKLKPTASPESIIQRERAMAHKIHEAREHTADGNIFTPAVSAEFKRLIVETMKGPQAVAIRQSLARSEPVNLKNINVDQQYPRGVPLQTTPPSLLANLPRLPEGFEYRVVNRSLVLLDVGANLIVDTIPGAIQ